MVPCTLPVLHCITFHWNRLGFVELKFRWNNNSILNADRGNRHEPWKLGVERRSNGSRETTKEKLIKELINKRNGGFQ